MRKLVRIVEIDDIQEHPNADSLELAIVGGWQVVVQKGKFKKGDDAVYCEIDSYLPIKPEYEFLRKSCYKNLPNIGEGFRIRTVKLRGLLSQGILFSLDDVGVYKESDYVYKISHIGGQHIVEKDEDISEMLGIKKYEAPVPASLNGVLKGAYPSFIPKTDQERIQNIFGSGAYNFYSKMNFEVTTKLDGTSFTAYKFNGEFGVCQRNWELKTGDENKNNSFIKIANSLDLANKIPDGYAIQGELYGEGIQKNYDKLKGVELFVFDVYDINAGRYLSPVNIKSFLNVYGINVETVPVISDTMPLSKFKSVNDEFVGCVTYGTPPSSGLRRGLAGDKHINNILELNRLVLKHKRFSEFC